MSDTRYLTRAEEMLREACQKLEQVAPSHRSTLNANLQAFLDGCYQELGLEKVHCDDLPAPGYIAVTPAEAKAIRENLIGRQAA